MKYANYLSKAIDNFIEKDLEKYPIDKPGFIELALGMGNRQMLTPYQRGLRAMGKMKNIKSL